MGFIENELQEVRKLCEHLVGGSKLVSCVPAMVRVEIRRSCSKAVVVCCQFPSDYPNELLLVELKSKTLSETLLNKLTNACDAEIKKYAGKPQVMKTLLFVRSFIEGNPLCCCYDEISALKAQLQPQDEMKLKQKTSQIYLKIAEGNYFIKALLGIPDEYPNQKITVEVESNLPPAIQRYLQGQAREKARVCVEPPLRRNPKAPPFVASPSVKLVGCLLLSAVRGLPKQRCQGCQGPCLPENPENIVTDENSEFHVERLYCNHLYHLSCLLDYLRTPPFQGGKKCPTCGERVFHDKWRIGEKLAEDRWAHEQARQRELDEVSDFFA
uniref:E3 ubiquitin protein ligase RIN2 n=1 Tax=Lygus hesperus TaxID=30085 RepID=A0A0A9Y6D9_LYGHE